ncbi:MAG: bifunctional riboflavin kinase/FMN adenylyltransferase, partial [Planctomycetes bacterium]|nr:bifunctional riboflavin kinase/FMN adenylyltransferase [Planctomycetota bacterium]
SNMKIIDSISALRAIEKGWALTIGNFDGVHLGHRQIIEATKRVARDHHACGTAVMTFEPHPVAILYPEKAPGVLTPLELKARLLADCGVDCLIVLKDSPQLLALSPEAFIDEFLMATVEPAVVVEGPTFNFGRDRAGNIDTLRRLGAERGFKVIEVDGYMMQDEGTGGAGGAGGAGGESVVCCSSLIRRYLHAGNVAAAKSALGRAYRLIGTVVPGRGVGSEMGFPTANIEPLEQIIPAHGVYAGRVTIGSDLHDVCNTSQRLGAVFSIGHAKTFPDVSSLLVEAHILEGDVADLDGKFLALDFVRHIRPQQKFETRDELKAQIERDCLRSKTILEGGD